MSALTHDRSRPARRRRGAVLLSAGLLSAVLLAMGLAACSEPPASSPELPEGIGPPQPAPEVLVDDNVYLPAEVVIEVGDTVTWTWQGRAAHDVVGDGFETPLMVEGSFEHTFDTPGTYPYVCTVHPGMEATVYVVPADD